MTTLPALLLLSCAAAAQGGQLLKDGTAAPDFTATGLDGKEVKLSSFKGKPVLLNFWFYD
jgi:cytochrome oxidase Cu insertion factor (SCO1/SenC/PrrC family)